MTFASKIKKEVLDQEFNIEQVRAFIGGVMASAGFRDRSKVIIKINNADLSNIIRDMFNQVNLKYEDMHENKNWIKVSEELKAGVIKQPGYYFAGVFVGGGSISRPSSTSYHLEIQLYSSTEAQKIQSFLNKYNFNFSLIQRRKLWVLYIKKSEQIADFLKAIQAFNSLLEFEDARIERDFKNQLNRYSNLDTYNQEKLARASFEFEALVNDMYERGLEGQFRKIELAFFKLKIDNPYSSLADLCILFDKELGHKKTKSGLSHYIMKLKKILGE